MADSKGKPFWKSKTIWVNALTFAGAIAGVFGVELGLDEETKTKIAVGGITLVNVVLRAVTTEPVKGSN
jgi:hypothetical protein